MATARSQTGWSIASIGVRVYTTIVRQAAAVTTRRPASVSNVGTVVMLSKWAEG